MRSSIGQNRSLRADMDTSQNSKGSILDTAEEFSLALQSGESLEKQVDEITKSTSAYDILLNKTSREEEAIERIEGTEHEFSVSDLVWAKIEGRQWWPGQVCDASVSPDYAVNYNKDRVLVACFGDGSFTWCDPCQLEPFKKNFQRRSKQNNSDSFGSAVQDALDLTCKIMEFRLACSCVDKDRVGLAPSLNRREGNVADSYKPHKIIRDLKSMARVNSVKSKLGLTKIRSRLAAFYRAKCGSSLAAYEEPRPIPSLIKCASVVEDKLHRTKEKTMSELLSVNAGGEVCMKEVGKEEDKVVRRRGRKRKSTNKTVSSDDDENNARKSSSRERKKSKYLSPPYTTSLRIHSLKNNQSRVSGSVKRNQTVNFTSNPSTELPLGHGRIDGLEKTIDLSKVLLELHEAAISAVAFSSLNAVTEFVSAFRCSSCCDEFEYKTHVYNEPDEESEFLDSETTNKADDIEPDNLCSTRIDEQGSSVTGITQVDRDTNKRKAYTPSKIDASFHEKIPIRSGTNTSLDNATLLFVTFPPSAALPVKDDLIRIYSKYGDLIEAETDVLQNSFCGRVVFLRTEDAEKAFNRSVENNPFKPIKVNFRLRYPAVLPAMNVCLHAEPCVEFQGLNEVKVTYKLDVVREKLALMTSIVDECNGSMSAEFIAKLQAEMGSLMETLSAMT